MYLKIFQVNIKGMLKILLSLVFKIYKYLNFRQQNLPNSLPRLHF